MKFISTYKIYLYLLIFEFSLNSILIILTYRNNNRIWRGKKEFKAKKGEKKEKNMIFSELVVSSKRQKLLKSHYIVHAFMS